MSTLQPKDDLEHFYRVPDPWNYFDHPDDARRKTELLSLIPSRKFKRSLDIGCGNGFITFDLPGSEVIGIDVSTKAVRWAEQFRDVRPDHKRFSFFAASLFDLTPNTLEHFDLIVITGVLYPQYIGRAFSVIKQNIDLLLENSGILVSCHINEWSPLRFPYTTLDVVLYPYRNHTHRLEIYQK